MRSRSSVTARKTAGSPGAAAASASSRPGAVGAFGLRRLDARGAGHGLKMCAPLMPRQRVARIGDDRCAPGDLRVVDAAMVRDDRRAGDSGGERLPGGHRLRRQQTSRTAGTEGWPELTAPRC